jgi:alkylhydroperoxidase family enzyme
MPRIEPLHPPYTPEASERLEAMMPPGVPPILLFRTFARNLPMARAMGQWGAYELSKNLTLNMRDREIVIDRTCARCGCEYEWGVHLAFFADRVKLTRDQQASLTHGSATDSCWTNDRDRILIEAVDAMHDIGTIDESVYSQLAAELSEEQILDLTMLCGWYHAISFTANVAAVALEPGAPRFADFSTNQPAE